ncbi:16S rRNA (guanine(527)-N(7))-methyltransferase RsmG [Lactobacillus sp. S2-2]|uniref:16S rRNA (guanine(527)-N(7))-methyltransferase RsmG n=1 Tax=Lactobacillus sp. S2-2 TaxID=2692917 RepID=UPI001F02090C|nr:16S rRNA (guanine(527)-N(7))-methyltransferase RsmG [Lactobacillus sp. S2-2]MCF6515211.1 16S rRNA (guanine(527)-N(7))-methyltransferase RsmG [Lactobacillus sp. S2-2]
MNPEEFQQALKLKGINVNEQQMKQFNDYFEMLIDYNQKVNLTTITDKKEVYLKHFYDSITPLFYVDKLKESVSLVDVGAGAGFPSLPMKIIFPQLKITIVDSLNKRIKFLDELINKLGLTEVQLVHARAEEFGGKKSKYREKFDFATARAVARMSVLAELCLPLVKVGGQFIALKAAKAQSELENSNVAIKTLGGEVVDDFSFDLNNGEESRHIITVNKIKKTPVKYPRKAGTPNKEPIGNQGDR